ncbi:MAG TPA: hypothetical protein H9984_07130 [Candidatus Parabacteroides faecavium]|nr:hypothetical protein [Candidatus Parabacteroides faecavium]
MKYPVSDKGGWLWSSRDAGLVCFGGNQFGVKGKYLPEYSNELCAMVYNNMWEVNVLDDCIGEMEFKFDIQWNNNNASACQLSENVRGYLMEPIIFVNPLTREDKYTYKYINNANQELAS